MLHLQLAVLSSDAGTFRACLYMPQHIPGSRDPSSQRTGKKRVKGRGKQDDAILPSGTVCRKEQLKIQKAYDHGHLVRM
jgi:hypothetical protein